MGILTIKSLNQRHFITRSEWVADASYRITHVKAVRECMIKSMEYRHYKGYLGHAKSIKAFPIPWGMIIGAMINRDLLVEDHISIMKVAAQVIEELYGGKLPILGLHLDSEIKAFEYVETLQNVENGEEYLKNRIFPVIEKRCSKSHNIAVDLFIDKYSGYINMSKLLSSNWWKIWEIYRQNTK